MHTPTFHKHHPLALRAWHWLDALTIGGLLGTVLLRKTFLSWRTNAAVLQDELAQRGVTVTPDVAKDLAVTLRDPMWAWHHTFGFILAGLLLARVLIAIFLPAERPLRTALQAVRAVAGAAAADRGEVIHLAVVKVGYVVLYAALAVMVASGLVMYYAGPLGVPEQTEHDIQELHETLMWFFVVFSAGHIAGVVVHELRTRAGIVSDMIHGGRG